MITFSHVSRTFVVAVLLTLPVAAFAQEATIAGTVSDSTGGVLPGVTIKAVHDATGNSFETVTDSRGQYRLPVRTGSFHLTAALQGFAAPARTFELLLGQEATINLVMAPSTLQESVTVTGDSPLVDFNQSKLGGNIDPRQMQELPVNGRNWQDLAILSPGSRTNAVTADSPTVIGSNSNTQVGSYQLNLDGQQVTNNVLNGNGNPRYSRDAIAEFELITIRFDATQGRSTGVQVNAITKSGTNTPAGTFSGYFRSDKFNAEDLVAHRVVPYSDQQISTTFGGPIQKDKIHFFGSYEQAKDKRTEVRSAFTPTAAERNGDFSGAGLPGCSEAKPIDPLTGQPFPGNVIPAGRIDTVARKAIPFEHHILQKSHSILAPDPTLWDRWPPEQGYLT